MQGEDNNEAPGLDEPRNSEIPTDPSSPSMKMYEAAAAAEAVLDPDDGDDGGAPHDRRPTDPSQPSHPSGGASAKRPATALDRAPRRRRDEGPTSSPSAEKADDHAGKVFGGKYRIERLIAKGGMGRVYRATQFPLERPVAVKILNREFQRTDPQFVRRFFLEAATAAKLAHPHTITVFDYGEAESGELYIAMEYLKGRPLSKVIAAEGPFPPLRALKIAIQVCRALREAHAMGIIHRDLKPGNVFLLEEGDDGDYAKVLDFGLVKLFRPEKEDPRHEAGILGEGDPELTRTGTLLGSPKYMSPEQIQGHTLDPRTDIYSFGIILFQMISGKAPFTGATGVDVIYKHVHQAAPSVAEVAPDVLCLAPVEAIIQCCLKKNREERYASMDELLGVLKETMRLVSGRVISHDSLAENSAPIKVSEITLKPRTISAIKTIPPRAEAGFRDPTIADEPTPAQQERSGKVDAPRTKTGLAPLLLSGLGLLVAAGTALYVTTAPKSPETVDRAEAPAPAPTPPAVVARAEAEISFSSEPAGAQVFEGARALGVTPFKKSFSIALDSEDPREFVFRLSGFKDEVKSVLFDGSASEVAAKLVPNEARLEPDSLIGLEEEEEDEDGGDRKSGNVKKRRAAQQRPSKREKDKDTQYRQNPY